MKLKYILGMVGNGGPHLAYSDALQRIQLGEMSFLIIMCTSIDDMPLSNKSHIGLPSFDEIFYMI